MQISCRPCSSVARISGAQKLRPRLRQDAPRPRRLPVAPMAFKITFKMVDGGESTVEVDEETYILDAADDAGLDLPYSCRSGTCSSCAAKIVSGELDQTEQQFLDEDAVGKGYALICVSYPKSDVVLETHKEEEVMG